VTLYGPAHGLLFVADDLSGAGLTGFDRVTFRNCMAEELTDFGIWCSSTTVCSGLRVENSKFVVREYDSATARELAVTGFAVIQHAGVTGSEFHLKDSTFSGGYKGIYLGGVGHVLRDLVVTRSDKQAVDILGAANVLDRVIASVTHRQAGGVFPGGGGPVVVAIGVRQGSTIDIHDCAVDFAAHVNGDYALYTVNAGSDTAVFATGNIFYGSVLVGPESRLVGNTIWETLTVGSNTYVAGNVFAVGSAAKNIIVGTSGATYDGNHFEGALDFKSTGSTFSNNVVMGATILIPALGDVQLIIKGNQFQGAVSIPAADDLFNSTIEGNTFASTVDFLGGGVDSLKSCTFVGNVVAGTFTCGEATRTTFSGNRFEDNTSLVNGTQIVVMGNWIGDGDGAAKYLNMGGCSDYVCVGNYVTGGIYVPAGAGSLLGGILVGNRCAFIDGGAAVIPTDYQIVVGNKVSAAGTIFMDIPLTTSENAHNIKDSV